MCIAELMSCSNDDVQRVALHLQATADVAHGLETAMQSIQGAQQHLRVPIANVRLHAILYECQILVNVLVEKEVQLVESILLEVIAVKGKGIRIE